MANIAFPCCGNMTYGYVLRMTNCTISRGYAAMIKRPDPNVGCVANIAFPCCRNMTLGLGVAITARIRCCVAIKRRLRQDDARYRRAFTAFAVLDSIYEGIGGCRGGINHRRNS